MTRDSFDRFTPSDRGRFGDNEYRPESDQVEKADLIDLGLYLRNDNNTKKAIAVSKERTAPYPQWAWLPRSRIEYELTGSVRNTPTIRVTLPRSLAREKGLVGEVSEDEGQSSLNV